MEATSPTTGDPVTNEPSTAVPDVSAAALQRIAFQELKEEIAVVDPDDFVPINVDIPGIVTTIRGYFSRIKSYREAASELPAFDISVFDKFEVTTLAVGGAHLHYVAASGPVEPVQPLVDELLKQRDVLLTDANALAKRSLIDGDRLKQLQGTNGYKNLAYDVLLLCTLLREKWATVSSRTAVKLEEIDDAENKADRLGAALGSREAGGNDVPAATALRQAAYTLFVNRYDQVRRAISFLRWDEEDVEHIAPSLYAGRGGRPKKGEPVTPVTPLPAAPSAPVVSPSQAASTAGSSNGSTLPAAASLIGLPGDTPFNH